MKRLAGTLAALLLLAGVLGLVIVPRSAYAATVCQNSGNPLTCACDASGATGAAACSVKATKDPVAGSGGLINKATLIIATVAGITAVIVVIIGGFMLVTANGDSQKVAAARTAIIGALVGLALIAIATSIVVYVVSKT